MKNDLANLTYLLIMIEDRSYLGLSEADIPETDSQYHIEKVFRWFGKGEYRTK